MADEAALDAVRVAMRQAPARAPGPGDRVHKEECAFSFATALSPGGLYLNLSTWQAAGAEFVELDQQRSGARLYLHEQARKVPLPPEEAAEAEQRPDKLAIGGKGGFQLGARKHAVERQQWLVVLPEGVRVPLPAPELPEQVLAALAAISAHESASAQDDAAGWEEARKESAHAADLPQLEAGMGRFGRAIPSDPGQWACDETGVRDNLWLNLSTGFIGSGRQNWDGSGGNGAAVRHFEATGRVYPLAVKLGTITPHGADVFSYAEDDMVTDASLAAHLAHWGINMLGMQKTAKTMAELQIDLNLSFEGSAITEAGRELQPLAGPGLVGLTNLGNSCYMASVLQLLCLVPALRGRYVAHARQIFASAPADPTSDFASQMAKVAVALLEGRTRQPEGPPPAGEEPLPGLAVKPAAFKRLVGRGHPEFSTGRQQDASEYLQFLLGIASRAERTLAPRLGQDGGRGGPPAPPTAAALEFGTETRLACGESGRVAYARDAASNVLSLAIPLEAAVNRDSVEAYQEREAKRAKLRESDAAAYIPQDGGGGGGGEAAAAAISSASQEERVLPRVPLAACLARWAAEEEVGDYYSACLGRKTRARKRLRLASFPPFLALQLNRFYLASDWTARKLEVLVDVPDTLDLTGLRARGLQPGEQLQPERAEPPAAAAAAAPAAPQPLQPDPEIVGALVAMGFSENGSRRAAVATQNGGTEASMEWVLGHMEDADFNDPLPAPAAPADGGGGAPAAPADPESVAMLASMGFTGRQATAALTACQGSLERAGDWLFSHAAELDAAVAAVLEPAPSAQQQPAAAAGGPAPQELLDGCGQYRLVGFVSHIGANTACGHYVCHLRKGGRWVIFNDEKVAVSERPPTELGYLYLFQRADAPDAA